MFHGSFSIIKKRYFDKAKSNDIVQDETQSKDDQKREDLFSKQAG